MKENETGPLEREPRVRGVQSGLGVAEAPLNKHGIRPLLQPTLPFPTWRPGGWRRQGGRSRVGLTFRRRGLGRGGRGGGGGAGESDLGQFGGQGVALGGRGLGRPALQEGHVQVGGEQGRLPLGTCAFLSIAAFETQRVWEETGPARGL